MGDADGKSCWRLIGYPVWLLDGEDLFQNLGGKQRALVAWLIVTGEPQSRDDLSEALWSGSDPARAKHSLRQALVSVRNALGDRHAHRLVIDGEMIGFDARGIPTDLGALSGWEQGRDARPERLPELLRGPLLEGIEVRSEGFDRLLGGWRDAFRERAVAALDAGIAKAGGTGELDLLARLEARRQDYTAIASRPVQTSAAQLQPQPVPAVQVRSARWKFGVSAVLGLAIGAGLFLAAFAFSRDFRDFVHDLVMFGHGDVPRIAVRPFEARNGLEVEQHLAGGVTIGVTYALYSVTDRELFVVTVPPEVADQTAPDTRTYAEDLGVRYLIHGALETDGKTVRVFVRLYDTESGSDVWQDRFDSSLTEAFSLQDEITLKILQGLDIDLSTAERNRLQYLDDTENLNAWLLAANGVRNLIKLDPANMDDALASYRRALEFDPEYTSARRGLVWHSLLDVRFGTAEDPEKNTREARQNLDVILRRRPNDGMNRALESLMLLLESDWDGALEAGRKASRLIPGSADAWAVLAHSYSFAGEPDLALDAINRAMELSPGHPDFYRWIKGRAFRLKGDYDQAIEFLKPEEGVPSRSIVQLVELSAAYSAAGRLDEARATAQLVRRLAPGFKASEWVLHPALKDPEAQSLEFELLLKAGL